MVILAGGKGCAAEQAIEQQAELTLNSKFAINLFSV